MKAFRPVPESVNAKRNSPTAQPLEVLPRSALSILGVYLLLVMMILASAWALIAQDWVREQKVQETELNSLARALAEKIEHDIGDADHALRALSPLLQEHGKAIDRDNRLIEHAQIELLQSPHIASLSLWSANGSKRLSQQQKQLLTQLKVQRPSFEYFRRNPQTSLLIHPTTTGPDGQIYLPVERILYGPQQEILAYGIANISISGQDKFLRAIRLTQEDTVSLLDRSGLLLAQLPASSAPRNPNFRKLIAHKAGSQRPETAFGTSYDIGDENHLGVFMWLEEYPLIISSSRPSAVASASFTAMKHRLLLGVGMLILLLGLLAWLMYYDSRRHRSARIVLRQINASLEDRVGRRTAELEQSNREMIAFSYSISHDLRAPLRAINGFAHALKEDFSSRLDAQGNDYLDRICRASVRMGELIDELLSLANVSRAPLIVRELDLSPIASDIIEELRLANPERQVIFQTQSGLKTEGDEALLRNALTNLIGNAWKFTRARRPAVISLTAVEDTEFVRFTLADNGIGFDMAHAKRLFQPFQQLHGDQGFGGTGIGLASVRRIIERHGGQIWAEATPEEGARFIFTLPLRAHVIRRRQRA